MMLNQTQNSRLSTERFMKFLPKFKMRSYDDTEIRNEMADLLADLSSYEYQKALGLIGSAPYKVNYVFEKKGALSNITKEARYRYKDRDIVLSVYSEIIRPKIFSETYSYYRTKRRDKIILFNLDDLEDDSVEDLQNLANLFWFLGPDFQIELIGLRDFYDHLYSFGQIRHFVIRATARTPIFYFNFNEESIDPLFNLYEKYFDGLDVFKAAALEGNTLKFVTLASFVMQPKNLRKSGDLAYLLLDSILERLPQS